MLSGQCFVCMTILYKGPCESAHGPYRMHWTCPKTPAQGPGGLKRVSGPLYALTGGAILVKDEGNSHKSYQYMNPGSCSVHKGSRCAWKRAFIHQGIRDTLV